MSVAAIWIFALVGLLAGFLAGLLGIGGGLVVVPALLSIFHLIEFPEMYVMEVAIGTSLAAMMLTSAVSAWSHYRHKGILWKIFWFLSPGVVSGAFCGSFIVDNLPSNQLKLIFGLFAILIGFFFVFLFSSKEHKGAFTPHGLILFVTGFLIGATSSLLGIGGGLFTVPILVLFNISTRNAIATSAASGFLIAVVGFLSLVYFGMNKVSFPGVIGYVYLPAAITIALASCLTVPYGASLAHSLPASILNRTFGIYLLITGAVMISKAL